MGDEENKTSVENIDIKEMGAEIEDFHNSKHIKTSIINSSKVWTSNQAQRSILDQELIEERNEDIRRRKESL